MLSRRVAFSLREPQATSVNVMAHKPHGTVSTPGGVLGLMRSHRSRPPLSGNALKPSSHEAWTQRNRATQNSRPRGDSRVQTLLTQKQDPRLKNPPTAWLARLLKPSWHHARANRNSSRHEQSVRAHLWSTRPPVWPGVTVI